MHSTPTDDEAATATPPPSRGRTRLIGLFTLLLVVVLFAVIPPLFNVNRLQQRIAGSIGAALGRPVHFDRVSLMLLPLPGFTLTNFVVDEDPAFGYEPVLRADQVDVTLRISSLWRQHIEFSKISFTDPSVNLVHAANGKWNIESLLLQAARIQAAPTAQRFAGPARRFPYIEATGARLNLKLDQEKLPLSLTDADFALWLPEPHQWHIRLEAHPVRTDSSPGDTGTIRTEGTLGAPGIYASSLAQIPIDLHGDWRDAQLGGISRLILGHDPGLRGDFSLAFTLAGTVGRNAITTDLKLAKARRADFVPDRLLSLEVSCKTAAANTFHSFPSIECRWPPPDSSDPATLILASSVPDVRQPASDSATLTLPALPADTFFDWLRIATPHPPAILGGAGTLAGSLSWGIPANPSTVPAAKSNSRRIQPRPSHPAQPAQPTLTGEIGFSGGSLVIDPAHNRFLSLGNVVIHSAPPPAPAQSPSQTASQTAAPGPIHFEILPVSLALGGKQPATLDGTIDETGYTLHLTGAVLPADLRELGNAVPQLGDGLKPFLDKIAAPTQAPNNPAHSAAAPIRINLTAVRAWGGPQIWTSIAPQTAAPKSIHRRRRPTR